MIRSVEDAWRDAAHGLRLLRRSPVFTATAALSLAIGVGANTAIFTVANALLLRPPTAITAPSELVIIGTARGDGGLNPTNHVTYREISRRTTSLTSVFAEEMFAHVMGLMPPGSERAEAVRGQSVTTNFFSALGSLPSRGRIFADGDEAAIVLDYDYWQRRFNGDDGVVGRLLRINGQPMMVVGVAAPGFTGTGVQRCDLWLALGPTANSSGLMAGGRLRPGLSIETAIAELRAIGDAIERDTGTPADRAHRLNALPFSRTGGNRNIVRGFSAALMFLVSIVLAVASANVAGIMLTRATARAREIALRAALGAGRGRLVRQLFTETLVLFLLGGLLGIGLAFALTRIIAVVLQGLPTPILLTLTLDWRVLLFASALSIATAIAFGVLPAITGSKADAGPSLKASTGRSRLRSAFVVGQIACSVFLVVLAASFVRVMRYAGAANPGFDPTGVEIASIDLNVAGESKAGSALVWPTMIEHVRRLPSVESATLARVPPGGFEGLGLGGVTPGDRPTQNDSFVAGWNIVDTGYFATLRIPLVAGRDFAPGDTAGGPPVVIVSAAIAQRFWPAQQAIGKPLRLPPVTARDGRSEQRLATVIGVAADIRTSSLVDGLAQPYVYVPLAQSPSLLGLDFTTQMSIVARRRVETTLGPAIVGIVQGIDPRLVLARTDSLADAVALGLTPQRVFARVAGAMGLVALVLASMGIYGVTAYTVALRRREFAIRLALGAPRGRVLRMVFRQGAGLVAIGLGTGLALATGAGRVLSVFLYGLPAVHVPTLAGTTLLFIVIGVAASLLPARQAIGENSRVLQAVD